MKKLLIIISLSFVLGGLVTFIVWAHRLFKSGLDTFLFPHFLIMCMLVVIPIFIFTIKMLLYFFKSKIILSPSVLFLIGLLGFLTCDFISIISSSTATLDIHIHDTYFVIANAHIMFAIAMLF